MLLQRFNIFWNVNFRGFEYVAFVGSMKSPETRKYVRPVLTISSVGCLVLECLLFVLCNRVSGKPPELQAWCEIEIAWNVTRPGSLSAGTPPWSCVYHIGSCPKASCSLLLWSKWRQAAVLKNMTKTYFLHQNFKQLWKMNSVQHKFQQFLMFSGSARLLEPIRVEMNEP